MNTVGSTKRTLTSPKIHIIYHGPGVSGKTTSLLYLHAHLPYESKGKMTSEQIHEVDRTIFFDLVIPEIMTGKNEKYHIRLQCLAGSILSQKSRHDILMRADAIVFVADSQWERLDANQEGLDEMRRVLAQRGLSADTFPWIIQYNKRDLPNIPLLQDRERWLNKHHVPYFETVAVKGIGVLETFHGIMERLFAK
jgi:GTPase SAR1 family protein